MLYLVGELNSLLLECHLLEVHVRSLVVTVQETQLQVISLLNARLQFCRRLNQVILCVVIQYLQLFDYLLLVLNNLALFLDLILNPPDFDILLIRLQLDHPL